MTRVTQHGHERGRERLGLKPKSMSRVASRAYEQGKAPAAFAGTFRRWLDGLAMKDGGAHVRIYGEQVWIFSTGLDPRLITVMQLSGKFRALLRRLRAREFES